MLRVILCPLAMSFFLLPVATQAFDKPGPYVPPPLFCDGGALEVALGKSACLLLTSRVSFAAGWDSQSGIVVGADTAGRAAFVLDNDSGLAVVVGTGMAIDRDFGPYLSPAPVQRIHIDNNEAFVHVGRGSWARVGLIDGTFDSLVSLRPRQEISEQLRGFIFDNVAPSSVDGIGGLAVQSHFEMGNNWTVELGLEDVMGTAPKFGYSYPAPPPMLGRPIVNIQYENDSQYFLARGVATARKGSPIYDLEVLLLYQGRFEKIETFALAQIEQSPLFQSGVLTAGVRFEPLDNVFFSVSAGKDQQEYDLAVAADLGDEWDGPAVGVKARGFRGSGNGDQLEVRGSYSWDSFRIRGALGTAQSTFSPAYIYAKGTVGWQPAPNLQISANVQANSLGGAAGYVSLAHRSK